MAIFIRFVIVVSLMLGLVGQANAANNPAAHQLRYTTAKDVSSQSYHADFKQGLKRFHASASVKKPFQVASTSIKNSSKPKLTSVTAVKKGTLKRKAATNKKGRQLRVTATAYNSLPAQTDSTPNIAAWGDRLHPGMKAIAVSRDLLTKYGLKHNDTVRISGLKGEYRVLDKMNKRWRKKIDIYMGKDRRKALQWGKKSVTIYWK